MAECEQQVEQMQVENQTEAKPKRNVLIAMDGSKHSCNSFEWFVEHIYDKENDNVIMAHCAEDVKIPSAAILGSPATIHAITQDYEAHVKEVFKTIEDLAKKHDVKKHTLERLNKPHKPGEAIVKAAEAQNVDLIIVGSRGMGTVRRTILGSVSDYIIHHSHVPVIVCKHEDEHHKLK